MAMVVVVITGQGFFMFGAVLISSKYTEILEGLRRKRDNSLTSKQCIILRFVMQTWIRIFENLKIILIQNPFI